MNTYKPVLPREITPGSIVYVDSRTISTGYLPDCKDAYAECKIISVVIRKDRTYMKLKPCYPSRIGKYSYLDYSIGCIGRTIFFEEKEQGAGE
jgi:hypothetical protein